MTHLKWRINDDTVFEYLYDDGRDLYFVTSASRMPDGNVDNAWLEFSRAQFVRSLLKRCNDIYKICNVDELELANQFYRTAMQLALDFDEYLPTPLMDRIHKIRNEALDRLFEGR